MCFRAKLGQQSMMPPMLPRREPLDCLIQSLVRFFIKYTLYDGPDALIANKLLEMGVTVNPNNVDWYKRTLIEQQSAAAMAAVTNANGGA